LMPTAISCFGTVIGRVPLGRSAADTLNFGGIWEALNECADFLFAIWPAEARKLVLAVKTRIVLTYGLALNGNGAPLAVASPPLKFTGFPAPPAIPTRAQQNQDDAATPPFPPPAAPLAAIRPAIHPPRFSLSPTPRRRYNPPQGRGRTSQSKDSRPLSVPRAQPLSPTHSIQMILDSTITSVPHSIIVAMRP
jgi:hypothetical protein